MQGVAKTKATTLTLRICGGAMLLHNVVVH